MHFRKEGADKLIPTGIDDKYEVIRILQESAATAVLLVNYKPIGAFRILKAIHKASPDAHSILSEAHLLQGIKSSQIPTIYDVDTTKEMIYFTEEYVEGISLRDYLHKTVLSRKDLIRIAIEICKIIDILHTSGAEPILYRDMKPEHVILQEDNIKLIDFGIAIKKSEAKSAKPMGTPGWAAKEQLEGSNLDESCDIYSVGKVIAFMQSHSDAADDFRIKRIVEKTTNSDLSKRTKTIREVKEQLEKLKVLNKNIKGRYLANKIAVVGADHAVGVTHIAVAFNRFFNSRGIDSYYKDMEKDSVLNIWSNLKGAKLEGSVLYHKSFRGILNYGKAVKQYAPPNGLYVLDCGTNIDIPEDVDLIIYVVGSALWNQASYPSWIKEKDVIIINNFSDRISAMHIAKELSKKVYRYPLVENKIDLTKAEDKVISAILRNEKIFKV